MTTPKEIFNAMSALRQTCEEKNRCILRIAAPSEWKLLPAVESIWRVVR